MQWAEISLKERSSVRFIDSHVHLGEYTDPMSVIQSARATDTLLLAVGIGQRTSQLNLSLGAAFPEVVKAFVGVHPSEVGREPDLTWMKSAVDGATGFGEIGLDAKYSAVSPISLQESMFLDQLETAERQRMPVEVHSRGSEAACLEMISRFRVTSVLLHWFQGEELLAEARDRGYYISFGPALLYSRRLQRMAGQYDKKLILTETDGPVRFQGLGGAEGPVLVPSVVFKLSEVLGDRFEELSEQLRENALAFLRSEKG